MTQNTRTAGYPANVSRVFSGSSRGSQGTTACHSRKPSVVAAHRVIHVHFLPPGLRGPVRECPLRRERCSMAGRGALGETTRMGGCERSPSRLCRS